MRVVALALGCLSASAATAHEASHAHGAKGHGHGAVIDGGTPGKLSDVSRTVTITATDTAFSPTMVSVKAGETIRLIVRNEGRLVHELTIGTKAMQLEHQKEMLELATSGAIEVDRVDHAKTGTHSHGNNVLLEPGKSGEIVWKFAKAVDLEFGCNIPGHYQQGMKGDFKFK